MNPLSEPVKPNPEGRSTRHFPEARLPMAYLFERFPAFTQTFCARELLELGRQGLALPVYSIRRPTGPIPTDLPLGELTVHYLPDTNSLPFKLETKILAYQHRQKWDVAGDRRDKNRVQEALYLGRRLRRRGITHVHAHFIGLGARTAWWMHRLFGLSYSLTAHAQDIFNPKMGQRLPMEKLVQDAHLVVTVTDYSTDFLRRAVPAARDRICRVYNGLDLTRFREAQPQREPVRLLSVGRLIEKKGFIYLLQACRELARAGLPFSCQVVGDGPMRDELAGYIQTERLGPWVTLLGARTQDEIIELLAEASIFVLPAIYDRHGDSDNLPTVIAEAMASGLPVVSTRVAGIPEMVYPGQNGFLVPEKDVAELARGLRALMEEPSLRQRFGQASRKLAQEKFDVQGTAKQLREIFSSRLVVAPAAQPPR
jgi:colanic acid/amylovoran biosynthesis glycosyltransferase